jgi:DUF4097 and DUF4098 domain-containing protein YvlB
MAKKSTKLYITIITIITIVAIIVGLYIHVFSGSNPFASHKTVTDTVAFDGAPSEMSVNFDVGAIYMSYGDEFKVDYTLPENRVPEIKFDNGELKIVQKGNVTDFGIGNFGNHDVYKIEVTVPTGTKLENVSVEADAGDVKIKDFNGDSIKVDTDAGNLELGSVSFTDVTINADAGNVKIDQCTFNNFESNVDAANIKLFSTTIDDVKIEADAGNVTADKCTIKGGRITTDFGNIKLDGDVSNVKTKTDLGNVTINGSDN